MKPMDHSDDSNYCLKCQSECDGKFDHLYDRSGMCQICDKDGYNNEQELKELLKDKQPMFTLGTIQALKLDPGDTIVLRYKDQISKEGMAYLTKTFKDLNIDNKVVILDCGVEMSVLKKTEEKKKSCTSFVETQWKSDYCGNCRVHLMDHV